MKRLVSMIAALAFCLTLLPVQSLAAERTDGAEQGLCPHHTEHTEDCGYLTDAECSFVCAICAVQRLIDGLPDAEEVTEETAEEIAAQIEEIEKAVEELSKQDAEQLEMEHYTEVSEALNVLEDSQVHTPLPQSDELVAKVTIDGTETEYSIGTGGYTDAAAAFQAAWAAAQGNTAVIDLVQDVTNSGTLEVNDASTEVTLNISDGVTLSIDRGGNNNCIKVQTGKFTLNGGVISTLSAGNNFSNVLYSSGGEVVLNGTAINSSYTGVVVAGGSVKIQNCEISVTSDLSSNYYRAYGVQITAGTGTIEGDTKIHVDTTNKTSVETCGVYLNGGTAVIESGTISVETGHLHSKGLNVSSGTAKVSGGTFFAKTTSTQVGAKASAVYWTNGKSPLLSAVDYAWYNEDKVQINIDMNKAVTEDTVKVAKKMVNITQQSTGGSVPLTYGYTQEDAPTFTIGAEAVNGGELTYQWYLNEKGTVEPVPGANTSSIRVPTGLNVISEQHKFYCIVSCNGYSLQSSNWLVYIQPREITAAVTLEDGPFEYKGLGIQVQPKVLSVRDENGNDIPESQYRITYTNGYNVGTGHSVTVSSKTGGNYSFITTVPFVITKAHRTLTITGAPETFTYGDAPFELGARLDGKTDTSIKWSVTNGSEVVSLEETADGAKITINGVGDVTIQAMKTGDSNYENSVAELTFTVQPKQLTVKSADAESRQYDGTSNVRITGVTLEGIIGQDEVSVDVSNLTGTVSDTKTGTYTAVNLPALSLIGADAEKYAVTQPEGEIGTQVEISKADQAAPDAPSAAEITDTSITLISAGDNAEYSKDGTNWQNSPEFTALTPNTEYTFHVRLKGDDNRNESPSSSAAIRTTKTGLDGAKVTVSGSYTYTGSAIVPAAKDVTVTLNGKTVDSSQYTIEVSDNIHAGTAAVTITATADGDFSGSVSGEYTIEKAALTIAANDQTLTYGESLAEGTDRVTLSGLCGGDTLKSVTFTASGTDVPGGEITLSAAQIENSDGTDRTEDYEIAYQAGALVIIKAQPAIAFASGYNPSKDYDGETVANPVAEQMEITGAGYDDVTFTWNAEPKDAGTYTLAADIAETGNREAASATLTVTIQKASPLAPKTGELSVADGRAQEYTYSLNALCPDVPDGMSLGTTEYTLESVSLGSYCTGGAKIEGKTLILPIQAVSSEVSGEIGTIAVTIHTGNFEDMAAMIRVRNISKIVTEGTPTLSAESILYGQTLQALTLTGSMRDMVNGKMVPGTFTWNSPNSRPDAQEKYAAEWTFTPDDTDTYANVSGTALIRVLPAPLTDAVIVLDPVAFRYDGAPHHPVISGVRLGETPLTADVDYTASIPEGIEAGAYTVTLTGTGNYTGTAAAVFQINPVEQKPLDQTDDAGHELRLEVETGLSTVPEILKGDTRFDTVQKIADALRVKVSEILSDVKEQITVLDITLQCRDGSGEWRVVDPDHFPADGVTTILPYPAGTGAVGYIFTVQHLISSGEQAGMMETLPYTLTADGLQCRFSSLSPVAIGYQVEEQPTPPKPDGSGSGGGGSSRGPAYDITVAPAAHGEVRASRSRAESGTAVTLTVTPDEGYGLDRLTVTDSRGNEIRLTAKDGKFTFIMPAHAVTVEAGFVRARSGSEETESHPDCPSLAFSDLDTSDWYHEAVDFVLSHGMMSGTNHGFAPNASLSRAMLAQILWSHAGKPTAAAAANFPDVPAVEWFSSAVDWAVSAGVVSGYSDGRFAPNDSVTREQFAVMLWRFAGSPAGEGTLDFSDTEQISSYAQEALRWAVGEGLISGKSGNRLDPQGTATRAEAAQMLFRFAKNL